MTTEPPQRQFVDEDAVLGKDSQIGALEKQVAQAQAELEEYQRMLNELPGIYEGKFRQKVRAVAQEIRQLLDERKSLQEQVAHALAQPPVPEALPPAAPLPARSAPLASASAPKTWADVRLPSFTPPGLSVPGLAAIPLRRWLSAGAVVLLLFAVAALGLWRSARQGSPTGDASRLEVQVRSPSPGAPVPVFLEARGGESWVLVEDLQGRQVFDAILQPGVRQKLLLGAGLRLRSGRPDLLFVAVGDQASRPLGGVSDLQWVVVRP